MAGPVAVIDESGEPDPHPMGGYAPVRDEITAENLKDSANTDVTFHRGRVLTT